MTTAHESKQELNSSTLRIVMISPWYGANDGGGVAITLENLVHGLRRRGAKVFVIKVVGDGWLPRFKRGTQGETIILLPLRGRSEHSGIKALAGYLSRLPIAILTLAVVGLVTRLQIVNFHYYTAPYEILRRFVRLLRYRFVTTFHGSDVMIAPNDAAIKETLGLLVRDAEEIVTVSGALQRELNRHFPYIADKCSVIHNTLNTEFLAAYALTSASAQKPDIDLLFVGGLISVKGPDLLIAALDQVIQNRPDTVVCLAGLGHMHKELEGLVKSKGIEANVKFAGFVPHQELVNYYNRARLVVCPSRSEGFSQVAMEAALCGKAAVAFDVGGLGEVVVDGVSGILVPPEDVDALANAILALLESPERAERLGEQARRRAREVFNPSNMTQSYLNLYDAVLNNP